ncbi:IQ calmodulin-binding motif-containing protein [Schistosoma japonicum]|uniref:IQ calmodulin-binding motif-containing protein n=1 Tax=Schistosoma japonicum TaxID=6182 RepID=A0A4Z2DTK7_SCHJA|nr:IQ calmodulin-binding motif-containing protein [Schistosoma japonicum]TNN19612.1 IQ calmodulin-binding motif-containing protein [Schistosoma japonicum]
MNKIKRITEQLQIEKDEKTIIYKLKKLYQFYINEKNINYELLNNYLINSNLPLIICNVLKQNFSQFNENWIILYQFSCFLLNIILMTNVTIINDLQNNIIESHLILLKRLQTNYLLSKKSLINNETLNNDYLNLMKSIVDNIEKLLKHFYTMPYLLLKSPWFLQLFISDNEEYSLLFINLFTICINLSPESFNRLKHSLRIDILDELIYHLSIENRPENVEKIVRCLITLLTKLPELHKTILKRYHGIQLLLMKWLNHFKNKLNEVIDTNDNTSNTQPVPNQNQVCTGLLTQLIDLINDSKKSIMEEDNKEEVISNKKITFNENKMNEHQAAVIIQSTWRGYSERMKLKHINENIGRLQRQFRERQLKKLEIKQKNQLEKELQYTITMNRHKRYRQKLQTEINLWSNLSGNLVEREWNKQRELAAVSIQRHYRGYYTRKYYKNQKDNLKRDKAARIIQLYYRKYLSRSKCLLSNESALNLYSMENDINSKQLKITKEEVLRDHQRWCESNKHRIRPIDQLDEVHKETCAKIDQYLRDYRMNSIKSQSRQATITRMKIDANLLLNEFIEDDKHLVNDTSIMKKTTKLNEIVNKHNETPNTLNQFTCFVQSLANLAQTEHHDQMIRMNSNKSWWTIFMNEWKKKQTEYIQCHNKHNNDDTTNNRNNDDDLTWLPDRFIEEMEKRNIFQ